MTRSSQRWAAMPGSFDTLHTSHLFPSDNRYGIPNLPHTALSNLPQWLAPYRTRIRSAQPPDDGAVHFFLDDYRFETVWTRPRKALSYLQKFEVLLTPDFSLYVDYPRALQLFNIYRNRWCGALWTAEGFTVIPTVSWGGADTFDFCFLGVPRHGPVAVSTVGTRSQAYARYSFIEGFHALLDQIEPSVVLCYGDPYPEMLDLAEVEVYPDRWQGIRDARQRER